MQITIISLDDSGSLELSYQVCDTPAGPLAIAATGSGEICRACFIGSNDDISDFIDDLSVCFSPRLIVGRPTPALALAAAVVAGNPVDARQRLTLAVKCTDFQLEVWRALTSVESGHTVSYSQLAVMTGRPAAACRAVASAVASNPVAVLIPCHRVVPKGGGPGNYRWGRQRKIALLEAERPLPAVVAPSPRAKP